MTRKYAKGKRAWGICGRSGRRMLLNDMTFDGQYPNMRVDPAWYEPKHPQEILRRVDDPGALWRPAPENFLGPTAPVLSGVLAGVDATLTWTDATYNESFLASYTIFRRVGAGAFVELVTLPVTWDAFRNKTSVNQYVDLGLTPGIDYTYYVFGTFEDDVVSPNSNEVTLTPAVVAAVLGIMRGVAAPIAGQSVIFRPGGVNEDEITNVLISSQFAFANVQQATMAAVAAIGTAGNPRIAWTNESATLFVTDDEGQTVTTEVIPLSGFLSVVGLRIRYLDDNSGQFRVFGFHGSAGGSRPMVATAAMDGSAILTDTAISDFVTRQLTDGALMPDSDIVMTYQNGTSGGLMRLIGAGNYNDVGTNRANFDRGAISQAPITVVPAITRWLAVFRTGVAISDNDGNNWTFTVNATVAPWQSIPTANMLRLYRIAAGNDRFVVIARNNNSGAPIVHYSDTGLTWQVSTFSPALSTGGPLDVTFDTANGIFIAAGISEAGTDAFWTSTDGAVWTLRDSGDFTSNVWALTQLGPTPT